MASASIEPESLARKVGVDPKTVQRWLGGRMPHPRHRWKICDLLGQSEQYIWPQIILGVAGVLQTSEIVSAYAHRVGRAFPVVDWDARSGTREYRFARLLDVVLP